MSTFDKEVLMMSMRHKFLYSMTGMFLGLVSMLGGIVLFLNSVAGNSSWTAKILGNESSITDAGPGAVLFIVGLFVIFVTRYKVIVDRHSRNGDRERYSISSKRSPH